MTQKSKILFIGGTSNQSTMMMKIAEQLPEFECWFSAYYSDGMLNIYRKLGLVEYTVVGNKFVRQNEELFSKKGLQNDYAGSNNDYEYVFTSSDLVIPKNIKDKKIILVQEGMTDPEDFLFHLVRFLRLPRYLASTTMTGRSNEYDLFCVASEGYKEFFISKGSDPAKIVVTGIPNFDNCKEFYNNNFPHKNFVLVCTSDTRETLKYENRKKFILDSLKIAGEKLLIFKLHPNENSERAEAEIKKYAPKALVFQEGNTNEMIANCDTLITRYSTVVYVGLALEKEVFSAFDVNALKRMTPIQNDGKSAENIANIFRERIVKEDLRKCREQTKNSFLKAASVL